MTLVVLVAVTTLGLVMSGYLAALAFRRRFVLACALLATAFAMIALSAALLALHLTVSVPALVTVRALIALLAIPCLYLYFLAARSESYAPSRRDLRHLLPFFSGVAAVAAARDGLLDWILVATLLAYAAALGLIWRRRETFFAGLGVGAAQTRSWLRVVIGFLLLSALLDIVIAIDVAGGAMLAGSAPLLGATLSLAALASYAVFGALGRPSLFEHLYGVVASSARGARSVAEPDADQIALARRADALLEDRAVLTDETLTIPRLARRLGVPVRQLSQALNAAHACSFSDLLNERRILLSTTIMRENPEMPLAEVMLQAGFGTKSNFYKQFKNRVGETPAAFRSSLLAKAPS